MQISRFINLLRKKPEKSKEFSGQHFLDVEGVADDAPERVILTGTACVAGHQKGLSRRCYDGGEIFQRLNMYAVRQGELNDRSEFLEHDSCEDPAAYRLQLVIARRH
jgi:hypothetical protein